MADHASLTVPAVLDRFNASEATLMQLAEKLRALTLAEEGSAEAARTIGGAASALDGVAGDLRRLVEQAAAAQAEIRRAVEGAARFLDATDLAALNQTVQDLAEAIATHLDTVAAAAEVTQTTLERQQAMEVAITARFDALDQRLAQLEEGRQAEAVLRKQLDAVRSGLSTRKLKQLGIEE